MKNDKTTLYQIAFGALIAALYSALTYAFAPISYNAVQFRISEVLTILPCFTPAAIPGLTVGCIIANIGSFNPIDMVVGTFATLLAAIATYLFRNVKIKGIPFISFLAPVVFNGIIVGLEIAIVFVKNIKTFPVNALWVALGELVVVFVLGIPLYLLLQNHKDIFDKKF